MKDISQCYEKQCSEEEGSKGFIEVERNYVEIFLHKQQCITFWRKGGNEESMETMETYVDVETIKRKKS